MTAITARLPSERSLGLGVAIVGLGLFGILCGVGLAIGELDALVASLTVLGCLAVLADFRVGAVLLVVILPVQGSYLFPHSVFGFTGLNPMNLVLGATLVSYLVRGYEIKRFLPRPLLWLLIVPMIIAGLIGTLSVDHIFPDFYEMEVIHFTEWGGYLRDVMLKPLLMVLAAVLVGAALAKAKKAESFLVPIVASVWLMSLIAIGYVVAAGVSIGSLALPSSRTFFSALGMHANDLGRLYAVAYALLLFTWGETKDVRLKTVLFLTMGILTIALVLTFSRGAMVGWVMVNALFLIWKFNARTIGLALLAAGAALLIMPGALVGRMSMGLVGGGADVNEFSAGRVDEIWLPLFPELFKSPIWGSGLDSTMWAKALWANMMLPVTHPHNAYIQAILDTGLLGLALILAYYWHVYRTARDLGSNAYLSPTMRGFYQGLVAGLLCFLVTGFAGSSLRPTPEFAFLWIAIGMMYGQLARRPEAGAS
ncbi:MAG: O-antigen ligase family protein [Burkholderiales bacterium]